MKILVSFRGANRISGWETGQFFVKAFKSLGHDVHRYGFTYETNEPFSDNADLSDKYDLHIFCEKNDEKDQYLYLKDINVKKTIALFYDTSYVGMLHAKLTNYFQFDNVFCANYRYDTKWFGRPTTYLPYACSIDDHFRELNYKKKWEFGLVGSSRPDRVKLVNQLQNAGINVKLFSDIFKENYINTLASCKVVINENPPEGLGLMNMRWFEATAAGCLLIGQRSDQNSEATVFVPDRDCLEYENVEDLIRICQELTPGKIDRIRESGQDAVRSHETYQHRALEILNVIQ